MNKAILIKYLPNSARFKASCYNMPSMYMPRDFGMTHDQQVTELAHEFVSTRFDQRDLPKIYDIATLPNGDNVATLQPKGE